MTHFETIGAAAKPKPIRDLLARHSVLDGHLDGLDPHGGEGYLAADRGTGLVFSRLTSWTNAA